MVELYTDIIKRCQQGDRTAQEAVYNLLAGKMFAVCMRYCANYEDAKDLLHDGFITVFTKIGQFQNAGSFEGWVRRIFVNQAIEWCRRSSKIDMVDYGDDKDNLFVEPENEDYDDMRLYQLSESDLLAMVEKLPKQYKAVFNLYVIEDLSHKEIAKRLGISESASRSNLLRARAIMQKQVKDKVESMPLVNNISNASK